jgi:hypothetical protein
MPDGLACGISSKHDAEACAIALLENAKQVEHPFLFYLKACMILKEYIPDPSCKALFIEAYKLATISRSKSNWDSTNLNAAILDQIKSLCVAAEERSNFEKALVLLKTMK